MRFGAVIYLAARFCAVIYLTVRFGAVFQLENPREGAVRCGFQNRKCYGAVRFFMYPTVLFGAAFRDEVRSVRVSEIANRTVRVGVVMNPAVRVGAVRCGSPLNGFSTVLGQSP